MTAAELRKKLDECLRGDTTGKSTPIQRLAPFLHELLDYLDQEEKYTRIMAGEITYLAKMPGPDAIQIADHVIGEDHSGLTPPILFGSTKKALEVYDKIIRDGGTEAEAIDAVNAMHVPDNPQVSSDDATHE